MGVDLSFISPTGVVLNADCIAAQASHSYRLEVSLSGSEYQKIEANQLFGFNSSILHRKVETELKPDLNVEIFLILEPSLQASVAKTGISSQEFIHTLQKLGQDEPNHLLLSTESWLILGAQQSQGQEVIGYRTVWDYFDWSLLNSDASSESTFDNVLLSAITRFVQDSTRSQLEDSGQEAETVTQLLKLFCDLSPTLLGQELPDSEQVTDTLTELITASFKENLSRELKTQLHQSLSDINENIDKVKTGENIVASDSYLLASAIQCFEQEQWSFTRVPNQPVLCTQFQGKSGGWDCYVYIQDEQDRVLFYSVLGEKIPEDKLMSIAEMICRVNYNLPVGNFELDFEEGELRCKTYMQTIDNRANHIASIKRLVYDNISLMDQYLPDIRQILSTDASPQSAIS
jgi:hypothetical protein